MRAIVFFCLLLEAFGDPQHYTWSTSDSDQISTECLSASCGCCLIQKQMNRMETFFEHVSKEMNTYLTESKTALSLTQGRSAFSVSLTNNMSCSVPASNDKLIIYGNVLLNLGGSYNVQNGIFTVPQSGVYCLTITIHASATSGVTNVASCARLQVNGQGTGAILNEKNGQDSQDSSSIVVALKLKVGDEVGVLLPNGCVICNKGLGEHYNTFTGFLLYAN